MLDDIWGVPKIVSTSGNKVCKNGNMVEFQSTIVANYGLFGFNFQQI